MVSLCGAAVAPALWLPVPRQPGRLLSSANEFNSRRRTAFRFFAVTSFACSQLSTPIVPSAAAEATPRTVTLRELCDGRVPQHILKRYSLLKLLSYGAEQKRLVMLYPRMFNVNLYQFYYLGRIAYFMLRFGKDTSIFIAGIFSHKLSKVFCTSIDSSSNQGAWYASEFGVRFSLLSYWGLLAAKPMGIDMSQKSCTVMALLDGGMLKRHKNWLKAEPPAIVVATIGCLCQMLEKHVFKLEAMRVLVIDEVDFMFNSSKQVSSLRKLLTTYSSTDTRQTIFASASIPQHHRFLYNCVQQKWTKNDVVHMYVTPLEPMPSHICHKFVICSKREKLSILLSLLQKDSPKSGIIFVGQQSEKSKRAGTPSPTTLVIEFLKASYDGCLEVLLLEEDMNFNARATSLSDVREGGCLLVATDIATRGFDLPETTHIYNFDLPRTAVDYLHRAGRTGRMPLSKDLCHVTSLITQEERFVLQRFENELMFQCEEL